MTMTDVCPWHEALPRPATYDYDTPLTPSHVEVLMRCAEKYELTRYTD